MKAIVKKARKRTKENGKPPSPTKLPRTQQSLEPTPASAWGSALRQYNAPSLSGNRWQQEKIADPATYVNNYDPKFDWDQVILDDWCFSYNGSRPLQLSGKVFNNGEGYDEGDSLEYTSQVVSVDGRVAKTRSGSSYYLGKPHANFGPIRMQLLRQGGLDPKQETFNEADPLKGIDLGQVVPTKTIKMPKVPGWRHDSAVALLHDWQATRNLSSIKCVGTAFNCPGAHDGEEGHITSDVAEIDGRTITTVDGITYLLGRKKGQHAADEEDEPLRSLEDSLAV